MSWLTCIAPSSRELFPTVLQRREHWEDWWSWRSAVLVHCMCPEANAGDSSPHQAVDSPPAGLTLTRTPWILKSERKHTNRALLLTSSCEILSHYSTVHRRWGCALMSTRQGQQLKRVAKPLHFIEVTPHTDTTELRDLEDDSLPTTRSTEGHDRIVFVGLFRLQERTLAHLSCLSRASLTTSSGTGICAYRGAFGDLLQFCAVAHVRMHTCVRARMASASWPCIWSLWSWIWFCAVRGADQGARARVHQCSLRQHKHFPLRSERRRCVFMVFLVSSPVRLEGGCRFRSCCSVLCPARLQKKLELQSLRLTT